MWLIALCFGTEPPSHKLLCFKKDMQKILKRFILEKKLYWQFCEIGHLIAWSTRFPTIVWAINSFGSDSFSAWLKPVRSHCLILEVLKGDWSVLGPVRFLQIAAKKIIHFWFDVISARHATLRTIRTRHDPESDAIEDLIFSLFYFKIYFINYKSRLLRSGTFSFIIKGFIFVSRIFWWSLVMGFLITQGHSN